MHEEERNWVWMALSSEWPGFLVSEKEPHSAPGSETFGLCTESPGPAFLTVDTGSSCFLLRGEVGT